MQFQVPQFIETESKIIGPLTIKQFIYIASGAAIIFVLHYILQTVLWFIFAFIIAAISLSFAFLKINGRTFQALLIAIFNFYWNPQNYIWKPENQPFEKDEANIRKVTQNAFSLESLISGASLKSTWQKVSTSKKPIIAQQKPEDIKYQIIQKPTGERRVVKKVDYI